MTRHLDEAWLRADLASLDENLSDKGIGPIERASFEARRRRVEAELEEAVRAASHSAWRRHESSPVAVSSPPSGGGAAQ